VTVEEKDEWRRKDKYLFNKFESGGSLLISPHVSIT